MARRLLIAASVAGTLFGSMLVAAPANAVDTRTISGTVALQGGAPADWLKGVQIAASPEAGGTGASVPVDPATGTYSLSGLAPGKYRIQFSTTAYYDGQAYVLPNLVPEYYNNATDYSSATLVDVTSADANAIDATLDIGKKISGKVTLPAGVPQAALGAVSVTALNATSGRGYASIDTATGDYEIVGLAPSAYIVKFNVYSYWDGSASVTPNLAPEYFNDSSTAKGATPVDVSAADRAGIDAALATGTRISGTVTLPADAPTLWMQAVHVSAIDSAGDSVGSGGNADPATGAYEISQLPAGDYKVRFEAGGYWDGSQFVSTDLAPEYYDNAASIDAAQTVSTKSGDVSGINAGLERGGSISGTIDITALRASAPAGAGYGVWITDSTGMNTFGGYGDGLLPDSVDLVSGTLRPGTYRVAISTSTWDEATGTETPLSSQYLRIGSSFSFTITAGEAITGVQLTARAVDSAISGRVATVGFDSTAEGKVLGSAFAYESLDGRWVRLPLLGTNVSSRAGADYSFGLTAGTYTVGFENDRTDTAVAAVDESWWKDQASLAAANSITLATDSTRSGIDGTLQPTGYHPPITPPSAPTAVVAVPGSGKANVSWDAPDSDGGAPITGYVVKAVPGGRTVTTDGPRSVDITGLVNGTAYTFTVVARNSAGLSPASEPSSPVTPNAAGYTGFIDVSSDPASPYYSTFSTEISWMSAAGISTGYDVGGGQKEYRPFNSVTRDAMAAFLYRFAGSPAFTPPAVSPFIDVTPSTPFYKEITWLASTGVTTGWPTPAGKQYRPTLPITRDAMAAFLYRFAQSPAFIPPATSPFVDIAVDNPFYKEITWLADTGITRGWDTPHGKEYRPYNNITRDAMAAFLYRYNQLPLARP